MAVDFETTWKEHKSVVFWVDKELRRKYGLRMGDNLGPLTLIFISACRNFDPTRGVKFASYYCKAAFRSLRRLTHFDSEYLHMVEKNRQRSKNQNKQPKLEVVRITEDHLNDPSLVVEHPKKTWTDEIQNELGSPWHTMEYLRRQMRPRDFDVIVQRFAQDKTLQEIGTHYGITRERVRQIEEVALKKIRVILRTNPQFVEFFP